ncbi:MAG TPA: TldD/PmbA family protein [Candidatus Pullichristensenella excrementigallinarum]|uniref:TldD/PmbA family protein n=1 Tax=Candidatus Pullichristensenella excrementigallinarum TaxID=2840907 RepID=A0A9D1IBY1_9FIRM|nr:TldD/PmbA family protein [Candidatus Pullichristensenella excrementigallinarum]
MLSKKIAEQVLQVALRSGGDFAELFYEDTLRSVLAMNDACLEDALLSRAHGAGIRVYKELSSVYVHTNDTSPRGLIAAAGRAADAIGDLRLCVNVHLTGSIPANAHPYRQLPLDIPGQARREILRAAHASAKGVSPLIAHVRAKLLCWDSSVLIANSQGLFVPDRRVYTRLAVEAVAQRECENQTGFEGPGALMGFELFRDRVDPEAFARIAAERAVTMLNAQPCPAGFMPVVIDTGFGGVIFHEACGHSLEAASVAFGNSEFAGKLGQRIASPLVTAIDDGTLPNEWGSSNIDDEGNPTTRLVLIEKGILKNYMVDRLNGRRMNMPSTGSGRRQNYAFAPTSRMRNTFIAPGEDREEEILSSMGDGLYAKSMGGGSVNPVTGEFNFAVAEGYLVRDGKIDRPVRGATLIGKGAEILTRIDRVGREMRFGQGMCGASSGSIPTNVGQPMIRVTGITVGGR